MSEPTAKYFCPNHGALVRRTKAHLSPEQDWCGEWYDCPQHDYTVLERSAELTAQLNDQIRSLKREYDRLKTAREKRRFLEGFSPEITDACVNGTLLS